MNIVSYRPFYRRVEPLIKHPGVQNLDMLEAFDIGPGWYPLVSTLVDDLFAAGWDGEVLQVKEKFGGLRFYISEVREDLSKIIFDAENESVTICDQCGGPGELRGEGYLSTRCEKHKRKG